MPVDPKLAATVVLLRERSHSNDSEDDCEFEVFMAKRHRNAKFMSEHHVFPGGSLDEQDMTEKSMSLAKSDRDETVMIDVIDDETLYFTVDNYELGISILEEELTNDESSIDRITDLLKEYLEITK